MIGTVYKSTGSWHSVKNNKGVEFECRIKGKLRLDDLQSTNPIAVGDVVEFDIENHTDSRNGIIIKVHDRKNYILRKSVNLSKQTQILAANIDILFLVITIKTPITTTNFIDRFLFKRDGIKKSLEHQKNRIEISNKFNRMVLLPSSMIHRPQNYFGKNRRDCRLTLTTFLD